MRKIDSEPGEVRSDVDAPDSVIREIQEVKYELHPTFPNPERVSRDPNDHFSIESAGWGEFTIVAHIRFRDGHSEVVSHCLDLSQRPK
jgi:transcription initiation factor IIF auxiliary subunit